jgi:hypothetical protein
MISYMCNASTEIHAADCQGFTGEAEGLLLVGAEMTHSCAYCLMPTRVQVGYQMLMLHSQTDIDMLPSGSTPIKGLNEPRPGMPMTEQEVWVYRPDRHAMLRPECIENQEQ